MAKSKITTRLNYIINNSEEKQTGVVQQKKLNNPNRY